jgi:drug/metabolite transporter (DMT)-like permease
VSRSRYRRRNSTSLSSVVDDAAHVAALFGPVGALTVGLVGFALFYAILPLVLVAWTDAHRANLTGPSAAVFASVLDQILWRRFIQPCQWAGTAILLVCVVVAAWKAVTSQAPVDTELAHTSALAKLISRLLQ